MGAEAPEIVKDARRFLGEGYRATDRQWSDGQPMRHISRPSGILTPESEVGASYLKRLWGAMIAIQFLEGL